MVTRTRPVFDFHQLNCENNGLTLTMERISDAVLNKMCLRLAVLGTPFGSPVKDDVNQKVSGMAKRIASRRTRLWDECNFEIKDSSIPGIGKGLFAVHTIHRGDTIGFYTGKVINDKESVRKPYINSEYVLWICKDHNIVGEGSEASYTRYINHSDTPNARFVVSTRWKKARVEALKRIRSGDEVFIDYGPYFWETVGKAKKEKKK
jgi:hypothetical protein